MISMRTLTLLTLASITSSTLMYLFMQENSNAGLSKSMNASDNLNSEQEIQEVLDKFIKILKRYQQINQEQLKQAKTEQDRLFDQVIALDTRLRTLEVDAGYDSTSFKGKERIDETAEQGMIDPDITQWMDEALQLGDYDRESSKVVMAIAEKLLIKNQQVNLQDIQCGKQFCRATFRPEKRNKEAVSDLFGKPPFLKDGFTVEDTDGTVALYFVRPEQAREKPRVKVAEKPMH
jgi:hypothetical protein